MFVVALLVVFAVAAITIRLMLRQPGNFPAGDTAWAVTILADVQVPEAGALVSLAPPWDTRHARLYGQSLLHPGMRQRRSKKDQFKRDVVLAATRAGKMSIEARFDLHISQVPRPEPKRPAPTETDREVWLAAAEGIPIEAPAVTGIIDKLTKDAPETPVLVQRIFEHVSEKIRIAPKGSDDVGVALKKHKASALGATRVLVTLLRAAHLPARMVTGVDLSRAENMQPKYWAEVYHQDRWQSIDVEGGHLDALPPSCVPLRKGGERVIEAENAKLKGIRWRVQAAAPPRGLLVSQTPKLFDFMDLTRLTPGTREVLGLLLLLPLGAMTTEVLRQIVGIRTYGTFTPTLLALAAVYVDWVTAATVFALVTILGISGRALLPGLEMTRVVRLSVVFTLVASVMALVVSLLIQYDPSVDSAVVLLPIVILTTLVDRIYAIADENGPRVALFRLGWTIVAALASLLILLQKHWGEWLLAYPEIHAITVAVIILLGRYRGRRLISLYGLGWLCEPAKPSTGKKKTATVVQDRSEIQGGDQSAGQSVGSK
jgi:hypothetical protein